MDFVRDNAVAVISLVVSSLAVAIGLWSVVWRARFDKRLSRQEQEASFEIGIAQAREAWSLDQLSRDVGRVMEDLWSVVTWAENAHGFIKLVDTVLSTSGVPEGNEEKRLIAQMSSLWDDYPKTDLVESRRHLFVHLLTLRLQPDLVDAVAPIQYVAFDAWQRATGALLALFPDQKGNPGGFGDWREDRPTYDVILDVASVLRDLHMALRLSLADAPWHEGELAGWGSLMGNSRWLGVEDDMWALTGAALELAKTGESLLHSESGEVV